MFWNSSGGNRQHGGTQTDGMMQAWVKMMRERHCQTLLLKEQVHALDVRVKELLEREEAAGQLQIQLQYQIAVLEGQLAVQQETNAANNLQLRTRIVDLVSRLESEHQINHEQQVSQNGIDELLERLDNESEKCRSLKAQLSGLKFFHQVEKSKAQLWRNPISLGTEVLWMIIAVGLSCLFGITNS